MARAMLTISYPRGARRRVKLVDNFPPRRLNASFVERSRTRTIQSFIIDHVDDDPRGIARRVAQAYGISRQAANRHLDSLVDAGVLDQAGQTRARAYALRRMAAVSRELRVTPVLNPGRVWDDHVLPILAGDRAMLRETCRGFFKEVVENAVAHAGASWITFELATTAREVALSIHDDGRGLFVSLGERLRSSTPRAAAETFLEQARERSTDGAGATLILLARGFDAFSIASSSLACGFDGESNSWTMGSSDVDAGTLVACRLHRTTPRQRAHPRPHR